MLNPFDTPDRVEFRKVLRNFVSKEIMPYCNEWDEEGRIPWKLHQKTGELGVWGFGIEKKYGGLGMDDCFMRVIFNEELGLCGTGGVSAAMNGRMISIEPIQRLASEEIKSRVLPEIVSGRKGSSLAITEPSCGSDVAGLTTSARKDGNHFIINGSKTFITGGMTSDYFVVGARTGGPGLEGISLFFLDADTEGLQRTPLEKKMGWWCSDQATLYFNNLRVPAENLMGDEDNGFISIMENFGKEAREHQEKLEKVKQLQIQREKQRTAELIAENRRAINTAIADGLGQGSGWKIKDTGDGFLAQVGYTAKKDGPSERVRHDILSKVFNGQIDMPDTLKAEVAKSWSEPNSLERLRKMRNTINTALVAQKAKTNASKQAIEKWEKDLVYIDKVLKEGQ